MLPNEVLKNCEQLLEESILSVNPVAGGDIHNTFQLKTARKTFFLKYNAAQDATKMFETEAKGLELLASADCIRIPNVIATGASFLIMEWIETGIRSTKYWERFGNSLAALHRNSSSTFGLDHSNFIGSLPQPNSTHTNWPSFFEYERLRPQMEMAFDSKKINKRDVHQLEALYHELPSICPVESPALIHGDLWSGNFLCDEHENPVLIDPSVSYAHREMDLAMSRLFGGFDRTFYRTYEESYPLAPGFEQRLSVYQLYYLLVHVNLFGGGYVGSVKKIIERF